MKNGKIIIYSKTWFTLTKYSDAVVTVALVWVRISGVGLSIIYLNIYLIFIVFISTMKSILKQRYHLYIFNKTSNDSMDKKHFSWYKRCYSWERRTESVSYILLDKFWQRVFLNIYIFNFLMQYNNKNVPSFRLDKTTCTSLMISNYTIIIQ